MSPNQKTGLKWEMYIARQLQARGYTVKMADKFTAKSIDMRANGLPIEVKFANQTIRRQPTAAGIREYRRWQWHIANTRHLHKGHDWALVLIAAADGRLYHYVVPGELAVSRPHIQLTSDPAAYGGWLSDWFEQWELIHYLSQRLYTDGGTYQDWLLTTSPLGLDYSRELAAQRLERWAING